MNKAELAMRIKELELELSSLKSDIITGRQAGETLSTSEEILQNIIKHDPNAIAVYDRGLNYLAVSNRYLHDYNVIEKDVIGKHHYEVFPEMPQKWKEVHKRCLAGAIEKNDNDSFVRPDGSITYNKWECRPWFQDNGEIGGIVTYTEVTTDRRLAEMALKESESSLRKAQKIAKMGSWEIDLNNQKVKWSDNCFVLFGLKPFEIEPTFEYFKSRAHPDDLHLIEESIDFAIKNKSSITSEIRIIFADGPYKWFQTNIVPVFHADNLVALNGINLDITVRKRIELALKESEEKFRTISEDSADTIFITDQQGRYLYTNKAVTTMLGYTAEEMKSKTIVDISPPDRIAEYFEIFNRIISEGKVFVELELLKKDGKYITVDLNSVLLPDGNIYASCRDITKRNQTEKVLKESESSLRNAQEIAKMGSWEWDLVTQNINWSDNNFAILGFNSTKVEASFELFRSRIHPDDAHILDENNAKLLKNKIPFNFELRLVEPDGTIKWIQNNISLVIEDDKPIKLKGVIIDITNFKNTELHLKESEEKYKSLIETSNIGIGLTKGGISIFANTALQEISGYNENEILSNSLIDLFHPDDRPMVIERMKKRMMGESIPYNLQARIIRKNGDTLYIDIGTSSFVVNNEQYVQATIIDITERVLAEQALKESETKLRQLNVDKDIFISILSHDLKSPFNNLLGLSEILNEAIRKFDMDEIETLAGQINTTVRNTYNLLEDILTWVKTQHGKIPFNPQNLNFADICKNILELLNPNAIAKNISINCLTAVHINVFGDNDMLKTILRNLVSNAIKFTNNGGSININAKENPENVTISVSDTGIGIKPENLTKLFDISQVISTRGTAKETGTGLGLLLCKEFVENHGGKIWVESIEGKGSDFKFTLPVSLNAPNNTDT